MRCLQVTLLSVAISAAKSLDYHEDYKDMTLEEMESLYKKLTTGPYCDENALTDPLCMHKQ